MTDFGRRPDVPIKLIQRGRISIDDFYTEGFGVITEVDLDKSILFLIGIDASDATNTSAPGILSLDDSTHVKALRTTDIGSWVFAYQVVEFKSGVKSVQRGEGTFDAAIKLVEITIDSVDIAKSILSHLGAEDASNWPLRTTFSLELTNSTTITARRNQSGTAVDFGYEVLEFI